MREERVEIETDDREIEEKVTNEDRETDRHRETGTERLRL